jgi:hypothetical protein
MTGLPHGVNRIQPGVRRGGDAHSNALHRIGRVLNTATFPGLVEVRQWIYARGGRRRARGHRRCGRLYGRPTVDVTPLPFVIAVL